MKSYIVIGLGRFGSRAAKRLYELGCDVLAIDRNNDLVQPISNYVTQAVVGDARDKEVLRALGAKDFECAIVAIGFNGLLEKFSFFSTGCVVFGTYFLLRNLDVLPFVLGKEYVLPALIILAGLALLVDAFKKPRKPRFRMVHNGGNHSTTHEFSVDGECFTFEARFGDGAQLVEMDTLRSGEVSCSFGDYRVDLSPVQRVTEGCSLEVNCSFGQVILLVPRRFRVVNDSSAAFGDVSVSGQCDSVPQGTIQLDGSVSFGKIAVEYV